MVKTESEAAQRPMYNILDKTAIRQDLDAFPVHWCTKIKALLTELEK